MSEILHSPLYFLTLTMLVYRLIQLCQKKLGGTALCNPLLISIALMIVYLKVTGTPLETYQTGGNVITLFLMPSTAALAISIYDRRQVLKKNLLPILLGCLVGAATSLGSVYLICRILHFNEKLTASLLPKSVTSPIAMGICERLGGEVSLTVAIVIFTGIVGAVLAPLFAKIWRVDDPVAEGLAIGSCSHAVGTSKALQLGETQGAMSSLAIGVTGIMTVLLSLLFHG